ncbi:ferrous iron transport protein A [Arachnia propionica]|uniref:Ferrous iron transport protein A n=1 Tax=Arachnia propionica TaxID=1750 RepID=A0A3P1T6F9_9ACTN|nr:FeoA family protein [Arachnia propionica]MDO5082916.1 FeoA family protein [Arachnia propionica]RRD04426.1 ferrous iron transport protein A [Arachnia propionica]
MSQTTEPHGTLAELETGSSATIVGFIGDDVVSRRLFDLGFAPGLTCELERRAPLGDPLMFKVGGTEIVLRRTEASRIQVTR